jgi:hypothetical protein
VKWFTPFGWQLVLGGPSMALKSKVAKFGVAVGMASIILSVVTWAMAQPSSSSIFRPELLLLY